jgi:hypothetical protein
LLAFAGAGATVAACSANTNHTFGTGGITPATTATTTATTGTGGTSTATTTTGSGMGGGISFDGGLGGGTTGTGMNCVMTDMNADMDGDGWTPAQGDCNDCDPNVNPGAIDVYHPAPDGGTGYWGNEDCAGMPGDPQLPCDDNLAVDDPDPMDAAKAVEICHPLTDPKKWGIKTATWTLPDGSPTSDLMLAGTTAMTVAEALANYDLGHGILSAFGHNVNVQAGKRMLGLSSGTARQPTDPGYQDVSGFDKGYTVNSPMGFPKESPACPGVVTGQPHDAVALDVDMVAPTNAKGFSFNFNFFTYEWPDYICSEFNDFFMALLYPIPMGQTDGNITFDTQGNPVSVNNAFLEVCGCMGGPPCVTGFPPDQKTFTCPLGDSQLVGTGFGFDTAGEDHGSTYWLETKAPVKPHEEITLRWAVYDSGDGILDTTALVDNFQWIANAGVQVSTTPAPMPK